MSARPNGAQPAPTEAGEVRLGQAPYHEGPVGEGPARKRPYRERPYRERPVRKRLVRERPAGEGPVCERPVCERPIRKRPIRKRPYCERPARKRPYRERPVREGPARKRRIDFGDSRRMGRFAARRHGCHPVIPAIRPLLPATRCAIVECRFSPIAQLVEQAAVNRWVLGSSPSRGACRLRRVPGRDLRRNSQPPRGEPFSINRRSRPGPRRAIGSGRAAY